MERQPLVRGLVREGKGERKAGGVMMGLEVRWRIEKKRVSGPRLKATRT